MKFTLHRIALATASVGLLGLYGCGGGGGGDTTAGTGTGTPVPATLSGKVFINQAVKNALVCMDLNANNACDTGEPTSAVTDAAGSYSLTYDSAVVTAAQVAAAPIIAMIVPGTLASGASVDAAAPTSVISSRAYVLSAPAGKATQINPLTTLVQTGIKSGMARATAEAAVALQVGVSSADIYDYQANAAIVPTATGAPAALLDNARMMAMLTADAMSNGVALAVTDTTTATITPGSSLSLTNLNYTDANNFFLRTQSATGAAAVNGAAALSDTRSGKTAGVATANDVLYATVYLGSSGWVRCDASAAFTATAGSPNRASVCAGNQLSAGYNVTTDVSGSTIASVLTTMQAATDGSNQITASPALFGTATFPAGSTLTKRSTGLLNQNIFINNTNTDSNLAGGVTTLEALIAARPSSGVNLAAATGALGLGLTNPTTSLLVAFANATDAVQYYSCNYVAATNTSNNCVASSTGTFAISTVNGVRILSYSGHPTTTLNHVRGHAEYQGKVAVYRKVKPDGASNISFAQRLNETAWNAMKALLPGV